MRVTLLTTNLARGGAEAQVALLAAHLASHGHDVSVVSLLPPSAFTEELAGVRVIHSGVARLPAVLRRTRPEILHCHLFHANLLGRIVRLVAPAPVVISTLHSMQETSRRGSGGRTRDLLYRLTDPLASATVAVCEAVAARHRRVCVRTPFVIPNAIDTARFRPDPELRARTRRELGLTDEFTWLAVGRLMWKKDYPTMLRAFAEAKRGVLLIAGEGTLPPAPNVRLLGVRADIPALMNAADACLLSSVVEGLPVVLLEAAACGLPAVATDVGGVRDIVLDGKTGYVVPPGDAAAFAAAMLHLIGTGAAMGEAARAHACANFSVEKIAPRWMALYEDLLRRC